MFIETASGLRRGIHRLRERVRMPLPVLCLVCARSVRREYSLCRECEADLPWLIEACGRCGEELRDDDDDELCPRCRLDPPAFDTCFAPFAYLSPVDKLILRYKFNAGFAGGYALARILARTAAERWREGERPDLLLPVPLHNSRLRRRGFNQALEIARIISAASGVPLSARGLRKIRPTPPQTEMSSAKQRQANIRACFEITDPATIGAARRIALIDDVVTTMSTASELTRLLKRAGVDEVEVCCLARAE